MAGNPNWRKGVSGNPSGRPRIPDELKKSCRRLAMKGLKVLEEIISNGNAKESDRLTAIKLVMEYGYGKPVQPVGGEGEEGAAILVEIRQFAEE